MEKGKKISRITVLNNGVQLITSTMESMNSVSMGIFVKAGGRYEPQHTQGVSHFLEHLLFRGSTTRTGKQISEAIEGIGGVLNGFTSEEYTCYIAKVQSKKFPLALDVLSDMFLQPLFSREHIERERGIITEELHMHMDQPDHCVIEVLDTLMWPDQPMGRSLLGTKESIKTLTKKDLVDYFNDRYIPCNTVISLAGNITHTAALKQVQRIFQQKSRAISQEFSSVDEQQKNPCFIWEHKATEQSHFALGFRGFHRTHPRRYGLKIVSTILGENMSSRLFQEVREKRGLAYDIHTNAHFFKDTGSLVISAGVETKKLEEALAVIMQALQALTQKTVPEQELERAKEYIIGQLLLDMEKTMSAMLWKGEYLTCLGTIPSFNSLIKKIRMVTPAQVQLIAREIFVPHKLNLAVVSPALHEKNIKKQIGI